MSRSTTTSSSVASASTSGSLDELLLRKPVSEKQWYMTWNQGQLFVWKGGKRLQVQFGSKSLSAGPVLELECINDRAIQILGDCKDKGGLWRVRLSLDKLEANANKFMQSIASAGKSSSHEFCKEINKVTNGQVKYSNNDNSLSSNHDASNHDGNDNDDHDDICAIQETQMNESRWKVEMTDMDKEISLAYIGTYNITLEQLRNPSPLLRVRDVKEWYVEYLAEEFRKENNDHEEMTAPLVVIANVTKEDWRTRDLNSYTFEVVGGVHRYLALLKIRGQNTITRKCAVYGAELSRSEILRLANQQNEISKIQRATTLSEVAATCRRLMFEHFATGDLLDDGKNMPHIPRYNTQKYREWKTECVSYLASPTTSSAYIDTALQMALQSPKVYHLLQKVFALYEEGKLKGQQVHKLKGDTLQKAIQGKFSARLNHFKVFQGLKDADKIDILNQLVHFEITWNEATENIKKLKQLQPVKEAFLTTMGLNDWKEAEKKYDHHANITRLQQFVGRDFKEVPKDFVDYCNEAKLFVTKVKSVKKATELMHQGQKVNLLECSITEISNFNIEKKKFELVTITAQPNWNEIEIANTVSRVGELNTVTAYYIAIFGISKCFHLKVKKKLEETCDLKCKIVTLVMPMQQNEKGAATTTTSLLAYVGDNVPEYIQNETTDAFICKKDKKGVDWLQFLLEMISKKSTILIIYDIQGEIIQTTTKCGHNALCICDNGKANEIIALLSDNDDTQIGNDEGELQNMCDINKNEDGNNTMTTRKRLRSEKDGTDIGKKKKTKCAGE